jgi:hypothetical protein
MELVANNQANKKVKIPTTSFGGSNMEITRDIGQEQLLLHHSIY